MKSNRFLTQVDRTVYACFRFFVKRIYPKVEINTEKIPSNGAIVVSNHCQLHGPIIGELYMPERSFTWANGQMFKTRDVPDYAMEDFFLFKPKWLQPICRLASYMIALIFPPIVRSSRSIPVYRDARIVTTIKLSLKRLLAGGSLLIFPESHEKHNNIINSFQDKYIDLAKLYYKHTGEPIAFLPMYLSPELRRGVISDPIYFDPNNDIEAERARITDYLMNEITRIATELPRHRVVPFDNLSPKDYPMSQA